MERRIIHGVRGEGRKFNPGDEAALLAASTSEQISYLLSTGAIVGDWGDPGVALQEEAPAEPAEVPKEQKSTRRAKAK